MNKNRRQLMIGLATLLGAAPGTAATSRLLTPAQTSGPFYPDQPPLDDDNDLTRVQGQTGQSLGKTTDLSGRIMDRNGRPLDSLRIEIWQCDATGRYHHPRDTGDNIDPNFQGFGHTTTDREGRYRFRTIRPVPYPGRTPHIHIAVFPAGNRPFVTQLYVDDEPRNARDFLFNRIPPERRHLVVAQFVEARRPDVDYTAEFDIFLSHTGPEPSG